eukprot:COSAG02_NODE_46879_length_345_cov_0.845528_1_plen_90_part_01
MDDLQEDYVEEEGVATVSLSAAPFCAVATQQKASPFAMGTVELVCTDSAATISTIAFADFGDVDTKKGCGHFVSGSCTTGGFTEGWAHSC